MAMDNMREHTHDALHVVLCHCWEGYYLSNRVNICEMNINARDSLIFNFSNVNAKIKNKNYSRPAGRNKHHT